jgi:hypothetical protein
MCGRDDWDEGLSYGRARGDADDTQSAAQVGRAQAGRVPPHLNHPAWVRKHRPALTVGARHCVNGGCFGDIVALSAMKVARYGNGLLLAARAKVASLVA